MSKFAKTAGSIVGALTIPALLFLFHTIDADAGASFAVFFASTMIGMSAAGVALTMLLIGVGPKRKLESSLNALYAVTPACVVGYLVVEGWPLLASAYVLSALARPTCVYVVNAYVDAKESGGAL